MLDGLEVVQRVLSSASVRSGALHSSHGELRALLFASIDTPSKILVTSRISPSEFEGANAVQVVDLDGLSKVDGGVLLADAGVTGSKESLEAIAERLGGHPLTLRTVARLLVELGGDVGRAWAKLADKAFLSAADEAGRLRKVVEAYGRILTREQRQFLALLSLHSSDISNSEYDLVVPGFGKSFLALMWPLPTRDADWVRRHLLAPLQRLQLIDVADDGTKILVSAHPLLKFMFTNWISRRRASLAHQQWARRLLPDEQKHADAGATGHLLSSLLRMSADLVAPSMIVSEEHIEAVEHLLDAGDFAAAYEAYSRLVHGPLHVVGDDFRHASLNERFIAAAESQQWMPDKQTTRSVYHCLAVSRHAIGQLQGALSAIEKAWRLCETPNDRAYELLAYVQALACTRGVDEARRTLSAALTDTVLSPHSNSFLRAYLAHTEKRNREALGILMVDCEMSQILSKRRIRNSHDANIALLWLSILVELHGNAASKSAKQLLVSLCREQVELGDRAHDAMKLEHAVLRRLRSSAGSEPKEWGRWHAEIQALETRMAEYDRARPLLRLPAGLGLGRVGS